MKVMNGQHIQSGSRFWFSWCRVLCSLLLCLGVFSAPALAVTFTFSHANGTETITNASTATWAENGETLRFSVTGASDYYPNTLSGEGLLGVLGANAYVGVDKWALASALNGSQVFSATVTITGKVFDLRNMVISSEGGPANYVITTSKGGSQGGSVGDLGSTTPSFSGAQFEGISSFTIQYTGTGTGGQNTIFALRDLVLENITSPSIPTVSGISPSSGPAAGGTSVVITGTDFGTVSGAAGVRFGSTNASSYTVDSASQITATAPAGTGTQAITVSNVSGTSNAGAASEFTYISVPTVSGLSASSGPLAGGNSIVLTGTNFTGATAVNFGASAGSNLVVNSATQITVTAPSGSAGNVFVRVTTPGGTSATGAGNQYTYVGLPVLTTVSPNLGTTAGGTSVTLTGTGFTGATGVNFGASAATGYTVNSATQITATAPAGAQGTIDITITTVGGTSATGASTRFTYAAAPTATTGVASSITATGATIAGTANDNGAATTLSFDYGPTTSYGSTATATPPSLSAGAGSIAVSSSLTGLSCNTTYHFRLKAVNGIATTNGLDASFTTAACPPSATTNAASALAVNAATLNATVNDNGAATSVSFEWGTSISYGNSATASPAAVNASAGSTAISGSLSGLTCNTVYHYRVSATSSAGTTQGSDVSFTTSACVPGAPTSVVATAGSTSASVAFTAPASNGGAAISGYTVTSSPGGLTGTGASSPISVTGLTNGVAYTFSVTATNSAGTGSASVASNSVTPRASQTITFSNPGAQTFGTTPTLSASSTSGLTVTFTSGTTGVCTITSGGALSFVTAGSCIINADQAGNGSFLAAPQASETFTVTPLVPGAPTIGTASAGDTQASVSFTAPTSTGGAAISGYTVTSSPGGLTGTGGSSPIIVAGLTNGTAYTFTVTATNSAGTGSASVASNSITPAATQVITFTNPGLQSFGTSPTLSATTTAMGLTPTFTSATTGVCNITSGGLLTFVTAGTCTINADQSGNSTYLAAPQVSRSFTVNAVLPGAPVIGSATAGNASASVAFAAPASSGGVAISSYTATSNPGGLTATGASSPLTVSGLTNGTAYTFTVVAANSVGAGASSAASNSVTPVLPNTAPSISGSPATTVVQGIAYSFVPSASDADGQPLTFSISNQPAWASFSATTGALSGVPGAADVGTTSGIVISVSDGIESAALGPFSITVQSANKPPVIGGSPETSVKSGALYSFTPTASDPDVGAVLTFSISNKPAWASFSASTGTLSGTPARTDVGVTSGIVISVSDGTVSASLPAFTVTVVAGNVAPVATDIAASTAEDSPLSLTLTAQDADEDKLSYEIVSQPSNGTASLQGNLLTYTPKQNFNGTDSIGFIAKDAQFSSNTASISLTVTAVNDQPVAADDNFNLQRTSNNQYQLTVLANDSDVDTDPLTIDGASSSVGTVTFNGQGLTLTTPDRYVGPVTLRYTLNDGKGGRASANVSLIIAGGDASNLPVITAPEDISVNATALFTRVPLGTATAVDRNGRRLRVSLINGSLFFAPGEHIVYWQATDAEGNTATKAQKVSVKPLISLSKDQLVTEGNEVTIEVFLNGPAPSYPVLVPYAVSGSAGANDHTLVSGVAEISSGLSTTISFNVLEDGISDPQEDIVLTLDSSVNRGSQRSSRTVITEANIAPVVTLDVVQNSLNRLTVSEGDGVVKVTATVTDTNTLDQVSGSWSFGQLESVVTSPTELSFDPAAQGPGLYEISYTATDNGSPNLSTATRVFIVVRASLPVLGGSDTDGDLIPDNQEGFADSDGDGIPDYQDAIGECNVMPSELLGQTQFLAEGEPGVCLRLGTIAAETDAGGLKIGKEAVENDTAAVNIGGIYDFIAYGLPEQGKSYSLVLPQQLPVPRNAIYRKYNDVTGWVDFASNAKNSVSSALGERGFCPPPGDASWTSGLTEGHWCVQVRVEDGGPNDADGVANGAIVDPGGVAAAFSNNRLPVAVPDRASTRENTAVVVNVLANDTDADGDSLTVTQAVAGFGTVTILADQKLRYLPNTDFTGQDRVIYSVTDGKGGTASSELVIDVFSNSAPVAVNDVAATNDKTVLLIAVLANDTDVDGNSLKVTSASAVQGTVAIEADQRLRYTPKPGFDGVDTISYSISDGFGGTATAQVRITITAYKEVVVTNKSSGGSMTLWTLLLFGTVVVLRRKSVVAALAILLFSPISQAADWYLQGSAGQSTADSQQNSLAAGLPAGTALTAFDKSDFSYGLGVGYQLHPVVAIEVGYQDLGDASSQISGESLTPGQYHQLLKAVSPVLVGGVNAALRFTLWQEDRWRLELPVGVFFWDSEIKSRMNSTELRTETDGNDWLFGLQLHYKLTNQWQLGGGYQQINLAPNDVKSWLLSVRYHF